MADNETQAVSRIIVEFVAPGSAIAAVRGENVAPGQWAVAEAMIGRQARKLMERAMAQGEGPELVTAPAVDLGALVAAATRAVGAQPRG